MPKRIGARTSRKSASKASPVLTTYPKTIPGAVESILKLGTALGKEPEANAMSREIVRNVSGIEAAVGVWSKLPFRVFCPIWKNPWMAFNADTYAHDVLRMLGFNNIFASAGERYPTTTLAEAIERKPDIVLLPDEPYEFKDRDVEELKKVLPAGPRAARHDRQRTRPALVRRAYGERADDDRREARAHARRAADSTHLIQGEL